MEIGICAGIDQASFAAKAGYDYIELPLCTLAALSEKEFSDARKTIERAGFPCRAFNLLLPGKMKILGEKPDRKQLEKYAENALKRAADIGGTVVVFGSGGARRIPDGMNRDEAWRQMMEVCRMFGAIAGEYGLKIVLEPLNHGETDLLNTVAEGVEMVREIGDKSVRLLADYYHMQIEMESVDVLIDAALCLEHCHIACGADRRFPSGDDEELCRKFLGALREAEYRGRLSVEGVTSQFEKDAVESLNMLKRLKESEGLV